MRAVFIRYLVFVTLFLRGVAFAQTQTLPPGWSMVGNDSGAAVDAGTVFGNATTPTAISASVTTVWSWNNGLSRWNFFSPSMTAQELLSYATAKGYGVLSSIAKGEGFWVNAKRQFLYDPSVTVSATNAAPVANAGVAQNVAAGSVVTLDGSASSDPNKSSITYSWELTTRPTGSKAVLVGATTVSPSFTADWIGTYIATLSVNNGVKNSIISTILIKSQVKNISGLKAFSNNLYTGTLSPLTSPEKYTSAKNLFDSLVSDAALGSQDAIAQLDRVSKIVLSTAQIVNTTRDYSIINARVNNALISYPNIHGYIDPLIQIYISSATYNFSDISSRAQLGEAVAIALLPSAINSYLNNSKQTSTLNNYYLSWATAVNALNAVTALVP